MSERRAGIGLRTRLLALVLVPVVLLLALTWSTEVDRRDRAEAAAAVSRQVDDITGLVELSSTLLLARTPVEVEIRAGELGLDPDEALAMLDLDRRDLGDLGRVADAVRALPADLRPFPPERVDQLARDVADGASQAELDAFGSLQVLVEADWDRQVVVLRDRIVALGDPELARVAEELIAASNAGSATAGLLVGLADHWFSSLDDPVRSERARAAMGAPAERFDRAIAVLRASPDGRVASAADDLARQRTSGPFGRAVDEALAGRPPGPFGETVDVEAIVATFTDSFAELQPLLDLLQGRSAELAADATAVADRSSSEADVHIAVMVALGAALAVLCVVVVGSVERPLRRLIDAMRTVGRGDLEGDLLPAGGPPELEDASAAFNDVLVNLRLLDGKVQALARADLDDPLVAAELPGALGRELDASVDVLASSIADRAGLQARLEHQATHDPLTGIHNRAGAHSALRAAVARAQRQRATVAVAFLDLDGFKEVNDRYGHATGDRVLVEVAARLVDQARAGDTCARMGGDEFIVIAEQMETVDDARALGRRIATAIGRPMRLGDERTVAIGASVGLALSDDPSEPPEELLHRADLAAYRAKRAGSVVEVAGSLEDEARTAGPGATDRVPPERPGA